MNITEDFVSFETAKLLKEKGFNERLLTFYITDEAKKKGSSQLMAFTDDKIDNNHSDHCYLAPTLQMAMKWLREVYKLSVRPRYEEVEDERERVYYFWFFDILSMHPYKTLVEIEQGYYTYEEACEAAIKYCLENLI